MAISGTFLMPVTWMEDVPASTAQSLKMLPDTTEYTGWLLLYPPQAPNKEPLTQNVNRAEADRFSREEAEATFLSL